MCVCVCESSVQIKEETKKFYVSEIKKKLNSTGCLNIARTHLLYSVKFIRVKNIKKLKIKIKKLINKFIKL